MSGFNAAIVGAGLSGLALAIALHQQSISCTLYEARDSPLDTGGGLILTPNGLKILQSLGIYDALEERSFSFANGYIQHGLSGKILEQIEYGNTSKYGSEALRAYRFDVLEQLLARVRHLGIPIQFNKRFLKVLAENDAGVEWQFDDGSRASASLLIGADGIHSTVREYIAPGIKLSYDGCVFLVAAIPTAQLGLPAADLEDLNNAANKHPVPCMIVVPQLGAFVIAPQTKSGEEVMISVMRPFPEAESWTAVGKDKDRLRALFREHSEHFPDIVKNAVANIPEDQLRIWPSYNIPTIKDWTSAGNGSDGKGRVVILGDAAHAVPPSAGQGVNQAFEDVYLLASVLGRLHVAMSLPKLQQALTGWQRYRQGRLEGVQRLNKQMEMKRLPANGRKVDLQDLEKGMNEEFERLFKIDFPQAVENCLGNVDFSD